MEREKGRGGEGNWIRWKGREGEGRGGEGRGEERLLNFHFIFQKTWVEPGNPG